MKRVFLTILLAFLAGCASKSEFDAKHILQFTSKSQHSEILASATYLTPFLQNQSKEIFALNLAAGNLTLQSVSINGKKAQVVAANASTASYTSYEGLDLQPVWLAWSKHYIITANAIEAANLTLNVVLSKPNLKAISPRVLRGKSQTQQVSLDFAKEAKYLRWSPVI